ncbi:MAG TPA: hypothetical protein VGA02_05010 [Gemmatimonadales bacterium]|jgi:hypothetical protein
MSKVGFVLALALLSTTPLAAQVGHDPARSPYRPILARTSIGAVGSSIWGSSGTIGVGPTDGLGGGLRFEMRLTGPTDVFASATWSRLQRLVADPKAPADSQFSGPVHMGVLVAETGLLVLLAGDKTWNGLAPYVGANLGLGFGAGVLQDTSGYSFSAKFVSGPLLGARFYLGQSAYLRVEGRLQFWKLSYPTSYFLAPERAPDDPPVLDPVVMSDSEWTSHPTLVIGLGYAFRF